MPPRQIHDRPKNPIPEKSLDLMEPSNDNKFDERAKGRFFKITLLIHHPSIDPAIISKQLDLAPYICSEVGEPRKTPTGSPLKGKYPETRWNHVFRYIEVRGFFKELSIIVDQLYPHKKFFQQLKKDGGDISLSVDMPGIVNHGSTLPLSTMSKMVEMEIELGAEIFPNWVLDEQDLVWQKFCVKALSVMLDAQNDKITLEEASNFFLTNSSITSIKLRKYMVAVISELDEFPDYYEELMDFFKKRLSENILINYINNE